MKKTIRLLFVLSVSMIIAATLFAQENETKPDKSQKKDKPKDVTLTGRIVDSECYMKMSDKGFSDDHHQCAESCAKGGIPLMFLEEGTNALYLTANEGMSMKSVNDKLEPLLDKRVTIKGKVVERSGAKLLVVGSIDKAE
ncbi:MAG: hypothetical protein WBW16_05955 [Bacteroidota bacterium]